MITGIGVYRDLPENRCEPLGAVFVVTGGAVFVPWLPFQKPSTLKSTQSQLLQLTMAKDEA